MRDQYNNDYYDDEEEGYADEYEEEGEEEQEAVRELPKPTKEEKDFLSIREKLKEKFRQKLMKERASTFGRSAVRETLTSKTPSQEKFGSFFGPSLPGIAPRVIEETKSIKENGYLHSSSKSSGSSNTKGVAPMSSRPKSSNGQQSHRPKVVNEVKKKAEILKGNRDYSFLFSDDADGPNEPSAKNCSQSKSDPSSSQPSSSKHVKGPSRDHLTGLNGRSAPSASGTSTQRHSQHQHHRQGSTVRHPQQQHHRQGSTVRHPQQQHHRQGNTVQRQPQQHQRQGTTRHPLPQSNRPRPISNGSHHPRPSTGAKAPTTAMGANKAPMKAVNGTSNNHPVVKKTTSVASNSRPFVSSSSSVQRHPTEQKRAGHVSAKPVLKSAQPSKPQPSKHMASSGNDRNVTLKKRPVSRGPFDDEDDNAIDMIRKMFNYNPNKYAGRDEDDSDMEVGFDVIQKEELRSSKIARAEDEEQLRLIEEEEKRERERMRKKQKLSHR